MQNNLEKVLTRLYNDSNDRFYSHLFFQVQRVKTNKIPTMGVGIYNKKLTLFYSEVFLNKIINDHSLDHVVTVLKHEALHIINKHIFTDNKEDRNLSNIAMDCCINQYLNNNHIDDIEGITLENFTKLLKETNIKDVLPKKNYEYYLKLLKDEKNKRIENGKEYSELEEGNIDSHEMFTPADPIEESIIKDAIKKAAQGVSREGGTISKDLQDLININGASKIDWKREINLFINKNNKLNSRKVRTKRNRRYGILQPGKTSDYFSKFLVVVDTSGSMGDDDISKCLIELHKIYKTINIGIDIVECDSEITEKFTFNGEKDFKVTGRGGTDFNPALEYSKINKYDGVIFFTDGGHYGLEEPKNPKIPVLWGIVGKCNFNINFGKIINID